MDIIITVAVILSFVAIILFNILKKDKTPTNTGGTSGGGGGIEIDNHDEVKKPLNVE